jgi:hypothetical protein
MEVAVAAEVVVVAVIRVFPTLFPFQCYVFI